MWIALDAVFHLLFVPEKPVKLSGQRVKRQMQTILVQTLWALFRRVAVFCTLYTACRHDQLISGSHPTVIISITVPNNQHLMRADWLTDVASPATFCALCEHCNLCMRLTRPQYAFDNMTVRRNLYSRPQCRQQIHMGWHNKFPDADHRRLTFFRRWCERIVYAVGFH